MRLLAITNMYPDAERPWLGTFVEQQVKGLTAIGIQCQVLYFDRQREGAFTYYRMGQRLRDTVSHFKPDLVHVMYGGVMARNILARRWAVPTVVTFHGSDLLGENLSGWFRKLVSHYGVRCSWAAARRANGIVVVARHLEHAFPRDVDRHKIRVIPCGIDLERFRPMDQAACCRELGWAPDVFHVLFPANAGDPVKRPWLAQAAVQKLQKEGVKAELHLLSGVPYADVPVWINASDVLILTSLHEGSPTVVKEALACNVPVVSVDVGDVAERLQGIVGCHLAAPEPRDLALKLGQVWQRRGRVDSRTSIQSLSIEAVAKRLEAFYQDRLGSTHGCFTAESARV